MSAKAEVVQVRRRGGGPRIPVYARDWLDSPPVARWRSRIAVGTFPTFYSNLWRFLTHIHKTPEEAIAWAKSVEPFDVLDTIQEYVLGLDANLRYKTKFNAYEAARSFFQHNRIILPVDRTFQIRSNTPPVTRRISLEHLPELIGLAKQPLRSMLLVKWMSLTDNEGLIYISNHHASTIVEAIRSNREIIALDMPGRKSKRNIRPHYTYIGHDAIASMKQYFERTRGWPKPTEAIWLSELTGNPYTKTAFLQAWLSLLRRAKLIPAARGKRSSRYGYNVHNTRDLAISLLSTVPNLKDFVVEFWSGHEIDPLQYKDLYNLQPKFAADQYRLAEPYLNIISNQRTSDSAKEQELHALKMKMEAMDKVIQSMQASAAKQL